MYIIKYKRAECIGVTACVAVDEANWKFADDGKVDLLGGKQKGEYWEKEITKEQFAAALEAAEVCPVDVIEIYEKETGKKVYPE